MRLPGLPRLAPSTRPSCLDDDEVYVFRSAGGYQSMYGNHGVEAEALLCGDGISYAFVQEEARDWITGSGTADLHGWRRRSSLVAAMGLDQRVAIAAGELVEIQWAFERGEPYKRKLRSFRAKWKGQRKILVGASKRGRVYRYAPSQR